MNENAIALDFGKFLENDFLRRYEEISAVLATGS